MVEGVVLRVEWIGDMTEEIGDMTGGLVYEGYCWECPYRWS